MDPLLALGSGYAASTGHAPSVVLGAMAAALSVLQLPFVVILYLPCLA